ncbi:hypothetical protein NQZ68_033938 [Dissostichus eleginoides]|nr:hypothetical protein NQZ68_033938 [Dissostichus eleginoides]
MLKVTLVKPHPRFLVLGNCKYCNLKHPRDPPKKTYTHILESRPLWEVWRLPVWSKHVFYSKTSKE